MYAIKHSVLFYLGLAVLFAQNAFEVVSIRRNVSGDGRMMFQPLQPGGRFNVVNVPLRQIILRAYRLQDFQLEGLPGWAASERYDITAKAAGDVKPDQLSVLLQNLLKERFQLVTHTVQKETTIFVLVLARQDGRLGPKLTRSTSECAQSVRDQGPGRGPQGPPPEHTDFGTRPTCGMRVSPFSLFAGGTPMASLAMALSQTSGKKITDKTGLSGVFDAELIYTPEESPFHGPPPPDLPPDFRLPYDPNGPSLADALREQWGIKLESQRELVDVYVIDRLERPTEN
jgi:uncharacterized protein (TIGR03435 family)